MVLPFFIAPHIGIDPPYFVLSIQGPKTSLKVSAAASTLSQPSPSRFGSSCLDGGTEKPFGTVRNITISNIDVTCKSVGKIQGNPSDGVDNFLLKAIQATAKIPMLTSYPAIMAENVIVNGKPLTVEAKAVTAGPVE